MKGVWVHGHQDLLLSDPRCCGVAGPRGSHCLAAQRVLHVRQQRHPGAAVVLRESHTRDPARQPCPPAAHPYFQRECTARLVTRFTPG